MSDYIRENHKELLDDIKNLNIIIGRAIDDLENFECVNDNHFRSPKLASLKRLTLEFSKKTAKLRQTQTSDFFTFNRS